MNTDTRFTVIKKEYPRLVEDWGNINNRQVLWTVCDNYNQRTLGIFQECSIASMVCEALHKYLEEV